MIKMSHISEALSLFKPVCKFEETLLKSVQVYEPGLKSYSKDVLYVIQYPQIIEIKGFQQKFNCVVLSELPFDSSLLFLEHIQDSLNFILICEQNHSRILNKVLTVFAEQKKYMEVSHTLFRALAQNCGVQEIVDIASGILENPVFVRDNFFKILAHTKNIVVDDFIWNEEVVEKGYQRFESFQYLTKNGFFERMALEKEPVLFRIKNHGVSKKDENETDLIDDSLIKFVLIDDGVVDNKVTIARIWTNIWVDSHIEGQMVVLEAFRTFKESDFDYLKLIGEAISQVIQKKKNNETMINNHRDKLLLDLLDGEVTDKEIIRERLRFGDWQHHHALQVLAITNDKKNTDNIPFNYLGGFFLDVFPNSICLNYKGYIVTILERRPGQELKSKQLSSLDHFMRDTGLHCGFSRIFNDLSDLKKHFNQSVHAMKNSRRGNGKNVVYYYDESTLEYVFSICSQAEPLREFCHPSIGKLVDYDALNHTHYVNTLYIYIMNFGKAAEIAQKKHMHRNTLYYRISKIEEIIGLDLTKIDHFFALYFSFKILQYVEDDILLGME